MKTLKSKIEKSKAMWKSKFELISPKQFFTSPSRLVCNLLALTFLYLGTVTNFLSPIVDFVMTPTVDNVFTALAKIFIVSGICVMFGLILLSMSVSRMKN